jgi:hypothetical protein
MAESAPLPVFETPDDARHYLRAAVAVTASGALVVVAVAAWLLGGPGLGAVGLVLALLCGLAGQVIYLTLCARIWQRHRPDTAWDWRTARGFHEGSITATLRRARQVAKQ